MMLGSGTSTPGMMLNENASQMNERNLKRIRLKDRPYFVWSHDAAALYEGPVLEQKVPLGSVHQNRQRAIGIVEEPARSWNDKVNAACRPTAVYVSMMI